MAAFRGETLSRLTSQLGESPDATQRGLEQVVPMTVAGVAQQAKSERGARDLLAGLRDGTAKGQGNQALSLSRANAVKSYLVAKGVPEKQIEAVGMSELNPIADNETAEGRARNRRAELIVTQR